MHFSLGADATLNMTICRDSLSCLNAFWLGIHFHVRVHFSLGADATSIVTRCKDSLSCLNAF